MISRMNKLNQIDPYVQELSEAMKQTLEELSEDISVQGKANLIDECSERMLGIYERMLGLNTESRETADRRSNILARFQLDNRIGLSELRAIANNWKDGGTLIAYTNDTIIVTFNDKGIPSGLEDLKKALNEARPAHLPISYVFIYNTWSETAEYTWETIADTTWNDLKVRS